jgi:prepilin-type N-terminal cleavage/methylation domain-containing protein
MIKKQRGMTLIELMISMMLGLGLVAGVSQLFIQSQKSFSIQRNLSDMTDHGSFILEVLVKGVLLAGYADRGDTSDLPADADVMPVSGVPTISFGDGGEIVHGKDGTKDSQLVYRYKLHSQGELDNSVCTSSLISFTAADQAAVNAENDSVVTMRIYKKNDIDGIPVFYCKPQKSGEAAKDAQPLISEVEKLVFKYGVRVKTYVSGSRTPLNDKFYYTDAATIDAASAAGDIDNDWKSVFAVKVFVVLRSADKNLTKNKTDWKIDGGVTEYPATDEKRLYKVFSKTIYLRTGDKS